MATIDPGAALDKVVSSFSVNNIVPVAFNIFVIAILCIGGWILVRRMMYWAQAWVLETGSNGTFEAKKDFIIKKKNKSTGEYIYKTLYSKEEIQEPMTTQRFKFGKKTYVCPLIRGVDGYLRPTEVVLNYIDEKGEQRPYITPIDTGLKDHIFHVMLQKTAKYKTQSTLEKLAPYGVMAMTVMCVIISIYLHNKAVA